MFRRGFAKKTLLKTARKAGFKQKTSSKRQKYVLPNVTNVEYNKYLTSPGRMSVPFADIDNLSSMLSPFYKCYSNHATYSACSVLPSN